MCPAERYVAWVGARFRPLSLTVYCIFQVKPALTGLNRLPPLQMLRTIKLRGHELIVPEEDMENLLDDLAQKHPSLSVVTIHDEERCIARSPQRPDIPLPLTSET